MGVTDEHKNVAKMLEDHLLKCGTNSTVISIDDFYKMAGRERLTEKFYSGVAAASESGHLLVAFGENVVAITRDVGP